MNKKKNKNIDVERIIKEIKENLINGTEMSYVKSLSINKNYKQKEINKVIKQIKRRKIKNLIKKFFVG
ncbi:MAG: hypothetical protein IJB90_05570 [Clostridia bacterium]|nr:hypothetical protein [Clostridia bacterium]